MHFKQPAQLASVKAGRNEFVDLSESNSSVNSVQPYKNLKCDVETMEVATTLANMQAIHDKIEHKKKHAILAIQKKALEKKTRKREAPGKIQVRTAARPINHPYATRSKSIRRNTDSSK